MAASQDAVDAESLETGDEVTVHLNSRASDHFRTDSFDAVVNATNFEDIQFKRVDDRPNTLHTWYSDIGYIHGHHPELDRHTDVGKVTYVERRE